MGYFVGFLIRDGNNNENYYYIHILNNSHGYVTDVCSRFL